MQKSFDIEESSAKMLQSSMWMQSRIEVSLNALKKKKFKKIMKDERGDVPGWVLVVLMTTGLVTAIWTIAAPRLSAILKNSLDAMNGIR
jgi:adenine C2-methylase RlmN of 23S rRNA A2503 and tRNA A37